MSVVELSTGTNVPVGTSVPALDWQDLAACRGRTTLMYADDRFSQRLAVEICKRCDVRLQCLADAMATEVPTWRYGVRGGLTATQRGRSGR